MDNLSVLVTANLIPSHPSITQIKDVLESLPLLNLDIATKIVITHDAIHPKKKELLLKAETRYAEYFKNLQEYLEQECQYKNVVVTQMDEWGHLTRNVANGLKLIDTEYVLIIQQDLPFCATIPIYELVDTLQKHPEIKHLKFNVHRNLPEGWDGGTTGYKTEEFLNAYKEYEFNGYKVCKTLSWSDQNHLTTKKHYEDVVLVDCEVNTRTTFMEGILNRKNPDNPERYGTYIYGEYGSQATIKNANGAETYYQDFIFDLEYCALKFPEFRLFNESPKLLKEMFVDKYGHVDCMRPDFSLDVYKQETGIKFKCEREAYRHWLTQGRKKGYLFAEGKHTALKVVLKTKDESFLLERWLQYHINLVGAHNIVVIDNNSERPEIHEIYARYDVLVFKDGRSPDTYHNSRGYLHFYENFVFKNAAFHVFLDTDEFLCFYDYSSENFSNSKLREFLLSNLDNHTLTTSWLYNNYYGKDYSDVKDVTHFSLNIRGYDVVKGKSVFRCTSKNSNKGHNCTSRDVTFCPELFTLHLNKVNIEERIQSKIRFVKSENPDWTAEEFFEKNLAVKNKWRHSNREIFEYYEDREKYLNSLCTEEHRPYIDTDVIAATIEQRNSRSYVRGSTPVFKLIYNAFTEAFLQQNVYTNNIKNILNFFKSLKSVNIDELDDAVRTALTKHKNSTYTLEDVPSLKIVLKTKNEGNLLETWLRYHAALVGWENLVVLDNDSDDPVTLDIYTKYSDKPFSLFKASANPNLLHDVKVNSLFYDLVRASAKHICFLDTDEFINFYDSNSCSFDFSALLAILNNNKLDFPLAGLWVFNSPDLQQLQQSDALQLQTFKVDEYALSHNINYGKSIVSSTAPFFNRTEKAGVSLCHNKSVPDARIFPGLVVFHLDKFDLKKRMANNLSLTRKRKEDIRSGNEQINKIVTTDLDELAYALANNSQLAHDVADRLSNVSYHKLKELVTYLKSPEKYLQKTACYDSSNVLTTNIIHRTVEAWRESNDSVTINNTTHSDLSRSPAFFVHYELTPHMTSNECAAFERYLKNCTHYYEFGIGGSTVQADKASNVLSVTGVESDPFWRYLVESYTSAKTKIIAITYTSNKWGAPTNPKEKEAWESYSKAITLSEQQYDLILVDGRFRTACGIRSYSKLLPDGFLLMHDYSEGMRASYKELNQIYDIVERVGALAVFKKRKDVSVELLASLWEEYKHESA